MIVAIGLAAVIYFAFDPFSGGRLLSDEAGTREAPPVRVLTTTAQSTDNDVEFEAIGTGRAKQSVQLFPAISDEITAINFKAGDKVQKGDVLVQLDDREEKLAVELAEVTLKDAKSLLQRYERAVKDGAVPQSEVDSARAAVDSAEVQLKQAKLALEYHQIIAPFAGVVGIPQMDVGDRVTTADAITGLDDREILHVDFDVPEKLAGALSEGQEITATTPSFPQKTFTGQVAAIENRINPTTRTIRARANIYNEDDLLRPGMSFASRLNIPGQSYPTVPEISVQWSRDGAYLWVVRDNKANKVPVDVIARRGGRVLVEGELNVGEPVVVEGLQRVRDGRTVEPTAMEQGVANTLPTATADTTKPSSTAESD